MRVPRIFVNQALTLGASIELEEAPSRHIAKVLRMSEGRPLIVFNGKGGEFEATISALSKKRVTIALEKFEDKERESPLSIELAIGVSRGERMDWVIQKATELGASRVVPLFTERCEVKLSGERLEKKQQHWQQIAISACEQCQRNRLPQIAPAQTLGQYLASSKAEQKFVLYHRSEKALGDYARPESTALLIGPEGGLSEDEIATATQENFSPLRLGPRVLRTETAPMAAISLMQFLWGDF